MAFHLGRPAAAATTRRIFRIPTARTFRANNRRLISSTSTLLEKITVKVPTMGDSITEGTIVEWTAGVGEGIKEGQVVLIVETDKVSVLWSRDVSTSSNAVFLTV